MRKSVNNKMASSSRFVPPVKQKKIVLTVENKLETIDLLRKGTSYTVITEKYGIGRSTITDMKNNEAKPKLFKNKMTEMGVKEIATKSMKIGAFEKLDEALYIWFRQQPEKDVPISGSLLTEKAKVLYGRLYPDSSTVFVQVLDLNGDFANVIIYEAFQFKVNKAQQTYFPPVNFSTISVK